MRTLLFNLALFAGMAGYAQGEVPGAPVAPIPPGLVGPGYGICGPVAHLLFDCPTGPGYMRIIAANVYGERNTKQIYIGSREACLAQAVELRAKRSQLATSKIVATCSVTQNTLQRWLYNELAQPVALPYQQYPAMAECLADAKGLNDLP